MNYQTHNPCRPTCRDSWVIHLTSALCTLKPKKPKNLKKIQKPRFSSPFSVNSNLHITALHLSATASARFESERRAFSYLFNY